jgi:hypothetical protein
MFEMSRSDQNSFGNFTELFTTIKIEVINAVKLFFATIICQKKLLMILPKAKMLYTKLLPSVCLVNRLRPILGEIVSVNQSASVLGMLTTDTALVAFECLHSLSIVCTNWICLKRMTSGLGLSKESDAKVRFLLSMGGLDNSMCHLGEIQVKFNENLLD